MTNQLSPLALAGIVLAGGLAIRGLPGPFGWLQTLTGLVLLIILFAYDTEEQRTPLQSIAFAAVCGFCLMLLSSGFIERWATGPGTVQIAVPGSWLSVVWVVGAVLFFFVDLMRMGGRGTIASATSAMGMRGAVVLPQPAPGARTEFAQPAVTPFASQPVAAPAPSVTYTEPERYEEPVRYEEPPAPPAPQVVPVAVPTPPEAAAVQPAVAPPPQASAAASGPPPKQVSIYVNLLGEGLNMMRDVVAQDLGRGYYLIVEQMPAGETWQFQTGQVVRCQKKNLASGKHLVAMEEAPRG